MGLRGSIKTKKGTEWPMTKLSWVAVDWGTTHLRIWGMDEGDQPVFHASSDKGMGGLSREEFEPALRELVLTQVADLPDDILVVACGMVGARQGWVEAPYGKVPCKALGEEFASVSAVPFRVHIISGLKQESPADVMRGEETQIAGYLSQDKDFDGVLCLPGSHTKWVRVSAEEVVSFQTAMTGELFAVLAEHTVLRHSTASTGLNEDLFLEAVSEGMAHPARLTSRLFSLRAETLLCGLDPVDVRTRMSGLLIGMELAATKPYWLGQKIALIGDSGLSKLYAKALEEQGCQPIITDATAMTLAGLVAMKNQMEAGA